MSNVGICCANFWLCCVSFHWHYDKLSTMYVCVCLGSTCSQAQHETESIESDVPAPPKNAAAGGKASLQPERTPVLAKEIEAILFYTYI